MSAALELWLVRHGQVDDPPGTVLGQRDVALADSGLGQLRALARSWTGPAPQGLWASDLARARASAEALRGSQWPPVRVDARLRELDFGRWDGCAWTQIHEQEPEALAQWAADPWHTAPPEAETQQALTIRVAAFSAEWLDDADGRVVVVAHGGSLRALAAHLLGLAPAATLAFELGHARLVQLSRVARYWRLGSWNLTQFEPPPL